MIRTTPMEVSFSRSRLHTCMLWMAAHNGWIGKSDLTASTPNSVELKRDKSKGDNDGAVISFQLDIKLTRF